MSCFDQAKQMRTQCFSFYSCLKLSRVDLEMNLISYLIDALVNEITRSYSTRPLSARVFVV